MTAKKVVYELVNIGYDDLYFTCGLFETLEKASEYIQSCLDDGSQMAWDIDDADTENIKLYEYSFGLGGNLRKEIRDITREWVLDNDDSDDGTWQINPPTIEV